MLAVEIYLAVADGWQEPCQNISPSRTTLNPSRFGLPLRRDASPPSAIFVAAVSSLPRRLSRVI